MITWIYGLSALAVGNACRAAMLWFARPSVETHIAQLKVTGAGTLAQIALGLAGVVLLRFPATVLVPLASYVLVRILLSRGRIQTVGLRNVDLHMALLGGIVISLAAVIIGTWIWGLGSDHSGGTCN